MSFYGKRFANTYKFLPRIGDHPIPDAEHTVILLLLLLALTFSLLTLGKAFSKKASLRGATRTRGFCALCQR
jgi:hypothetical protein